ncbi:MAG: hypothetical protein ACTTJF_00905 [Campylobacter sp.]|uniref:hypothetical protein n=1 Tax=Campylobacter sp. TaxID=205 RepID=UPI003FA06671
MNQCEITLELVKLAAQEGAFEGASPKELPQLIAKTFNEIKAEVFPKATPKPETEQPSDEDGYL